MSQGRSLFVSLCVAMLGMVALAERIEFRLDGWTCDGEKVSVPHTWNAIDGADGSSNVFQDADNSIAGRAFERRTSTYRTKLPSPTPGKRQFIRCEGAAVVATVCVNGRIVGRHHGAFTAFCFEITDFLREHDNVLEVVVDNHFDPEEPPNYGDYTIEGGLYRPVWLIETDPICIDPTRFGGPGVEIDTDADTGRVDVMGFSNVGEVELVVNDRVIGRRMPDSVRTVVWNGVMLRKGTNEIELRAGLLTDRCTWRYRPESKKGQFKGK